MNTISCGKKRSPVNSKIETAGLLIKPDAASSVTRIVERTVKLLETMSDAAADALEWPDFMCRVL